MIRRMPAIAEAGPDFPYKILISCPRNICHIPVWAISGCTMYYRAIKTYFVGALFSRYFITGTRQPIM